MTSFLEYAEDFLSLFFPQLCAACNTNLYKNENLICTRCLLDLPITNFHRYPHNDVAKQLWGRIQFEAAYSYLYFHKGSIVQNMIHKLKYQNMPELGLKLGEMYGHELKLSSAGMDIDLILPVPLHPKRHKKRGYNQSAFFAEGLSKSLSIPVDASLKRGIFTYSQTRKSRFMRYENMQDVFHLTEQENLRNKHILLVDDVFTTGATIESCAMKLSEIEGLRLSIATIAFTSF